LFRAFQNLPAALPAIGDGRIRMYERFQTYGPFECGALEAPDKPARYEFSQSSICLAFAASFLDRAMSNAFCAVAMASED
jgi:hypothetical protein